MENRHQMETEEVSRIIDMDCISFMDYCKDKSDSECMTLNQRLDIEFRYVHSEITKLRAKLITEAFKDTNKPAYREGTMDSVPEERSITPDQVRNVEYFLSVLNNLYYAIAKINAKQFVLEGIIKMKAEELMSGK